MPIGSVAGDSTELSRGISTRPIAAGDLPLLHRIYCSTRVDELAQIDWSTEQRDGFLRQQFDLQHRYYQQHFPHAQFCVVQCAGQDVGRLYVDRNGTELRLIDIALLPQWRGHGIGSRILQGLLTEADECNAEVVLHVEANNPALALYLRLGFEPVAANGVYVKLSRQPRRMACTKHQ